MKNLVFLGDSVTDCKRKRASRYQLSSEGLGHGWVRYVDKTLNAQNSEYQLWNRGYSGSLIAELVDQEGFWPEQDEMPITANIASLMIGINDVWHPFWRARAHQIPEAVEAFRQTLDTLLQRSQQVVVMEPIALPVGEVTQDWWPILNQLTQQQEAVCQQLGVTWLALQEPLMNSAHGKLTDYLADGVHPTDLGHRWLAKQWLNCVVDQKWL